MDRINNLASSFREANKDVVWLNWGIDPSLAGMSDSQKYKFNNFEYPDSLSWKREKNSGKKVLEIESWSARVIKELNVSDQDIKVSKQRISGFWYSELEETLKDLGIERLYFTGINADQCVITTLQDAHFAGFDCYLVEDCTATASPSFCMDATLLNVKNCFGTVINSEQL